MAADERPTKKSNHTPAEKNPSKSVITEYNNTCRSLPNHNYSVLAICCVHTYMSIYMAMKDFNKCSYKVYTYNEPRAAYIRLKSNNPVPGTQPPQKIASSIEIFQLHW